MVSVWYCGCHSSNTWFFLQCVIVAPDPGTRLLMTMCYSSQGYTLLPPIQLDEDQQLHLTAGELQPEHNLDGVWHLGLNLLGCKRLRRERRSSVPEVNAKTCQQLSK